MSNKGKARAIREFYAKSQTSNNIYKMKVDMRLLNKQLSTIKDIDTYLDEQYKEFGITRFHTKNDMMKYIVNTGNINNVKLYNKTIEQRWKEYQHREDLMITGQYQNYMRNYYKNNYIGKLAEAGIDDNIIRALQELNEQEWTTLASLRASDKDNPNNYALPMIDTYYDVEGIKGDKDYKTTIEKDIKNAYTKALGKFITTDEMRYGFNGGLIDEPQFKDLSAEQQYKEFAYKNDNKLSKLLRKVPRRLRENIKFYKDTINIKDNKSLYHNYQSEKEARFATIELMEKHGSAKMRTSRKGTQYYPFYLNRNETAEYIAWKNNKRGK